MKSRRGSALVLVLLMTLAVAALAVAAIFMSSSAGLLSRFYDREREYRLAAESALELARSRLANDPLLAIPDTGVRVIESGIRIPKSDGTIGTNIYVAVRAATTGDTTGIGLPYVSLIATASDASGTRYAQRMDLRRESFYRYGFFVDSFPSSFSFGPGTIQGRVHSNDSWRSTTGAVYRDTVSAVVSLTGTATYRADTLSGVAPILFPRDSTFPRLVTLSTAANLRATAVSGSGGGWVRGSRLEFVTVDANANGRIDQSEGFARVFDLETGMDTSRIRASMDPVISLGEYWEDGIIQNQCGAFYWRTNRWHFFPVATHRATWARAIIQQTGSSAYPAVTNGTMNNMDDYDYSATTLILSQPTARCFPAGSPYLVTTERFTNSAGVITGTAADTVPFGVVPPSGGWPGSAPSGYGGADTTFTAVTQTCRISSGSTSGRCDTGTRLPLGRWRSFGGTAVTGISSSIRQAAELPYLWPLHSSRNSTSRGVVSVSGPFFVSGIVRGRVTLYADSNVTIIDQLRQHTAGGDPGTELCDDIFGLVARQSILLADNSIFRSKGILRLTPSVAVTFLRVGGDRAAVLNGAFMSLAGTVAAEGATRTSTYFALALPCPETGSANSDGGCLQLTGGLAMRRFGQFHSSTSNTGFRWAGVPDRCQSTGNRPPFYPLTNRYTVVRSVEIDAARANTPDRVRSLLLSLKGRTF